MASSKTTLIISILITTGMIQATTLGYTSYIFTTKDVVFFAYENGTTVEMYRSTGQQEVPPTTLNKGEHLFKQLNDLNQVYKVVGSKKFAVLTGDPASVSVSRSIQHQVPTHSSFNQSLIHFAVFWHTRYPALGGITTY